MWQFSFTYVKNESSPYNRLRRPRSGVEVQLYSSFNLGARGGVGDKCYSPAALPPGKTRYPFYRRLSVPHDRSGQVQKISPPSGFDPRTVQPVASSCTACAIPAG